MNFKQSTLILFFLMAFASVKACGPESSRRDFCLFLKTFNEGAPLFDYYFNSTNFYYGDWYRGLDDRDDENANTKEWVQLLDNKFTAPEITSLLNTIDDPILALYQSDKDYTKYLKKGSLENFLYYKKPELWQYVLQLWAYNKYLQIYDDEWDYQAYVYRADSSEVMKMVSDTKAIYNKTQNKNLKWRCAYHMVRMAHFHQYKNLARSLYNQYVLPLPSGISVIEQWCNGLNGGILYNENKHEESFLYFARRFQNDPYSMHQAYIDLKQAEDLPLPKLLAVCTNNKDSIAVMVANSVRSPNFDLNTVRMMEQTNPNAPEIQFIYQREMQKIEAEYGEEQLMGAGKAVWYNEEYKFPRASAFTEFLNFTLAKAKHAKTYRPFWNNALAYLYTINKDYKNAKKYLKAAKNSPGPTSIDKAQTKMLEMLLVCLQKKRIDKLEIAQYTIDFHNNKNISADDANSFSIFNYNFVVPTLLKQGDTTEALMLAMFRDELTPWNDMYYEGPNGTIDSIDIFNSSQLARYYLDYHFDKLTFERVINEIRHPTTSFTQKLASRFTYFYNPKDYNRNLLYKSVRTEDWSSAKKYEKSCGEYFDNTNYFSPFIFHYDDYREPQRKDTLAGLMTAQQLLTLGENLKEKANQKDATALYRYGMYLFHMTYYGFNRSLMDYNTYEYRRYNAPVYFKYDKMETEEWYFYYHSLYEVALNKSALAYYDCSQAADVFLSALRNSNDKEQKAKINFMLARCHQKNAPVPKMIKNEEYGWYDPAPVDYRGKKYDSYQYHSFTNPYLKELINNYQETDTYKEAFAECSYLRMFLN